MPARERLIAVRRPTGPAPTIMTPKWVSVREPIVVLEMLGRTGVLRNEGREL